jgi:hypothetical protein
MTEFQRRQLTLVSHHGAKPAGFASLIADLQSRLRSSLGDRFLPYETEQVHGTIVGLEGTVVGDRVRNDNFLRHRGQEQWMDFERLLRFLRSAAFPDLTIAVGAFQPGARYPFASQGRHPHDRSFVIHQGTVVVMGWPAAGGGFANALDVVRRRFQDFGVLHKWHGRPDAIDNDFFFVLGRVADGLSEKDRVDAELAGRAWLAGREPCLIPVTTKSLSFVAYDNPWLAVHEIQRFSVMDDRVTPEFLKSLYGR